jgi:hypothetical protein
MHSNPAIATLIDTDGRRRYLDVDEEYVELTEMEARAFGESDGWVIDTHFGSTELFEGLELDYIDDM